MSVVGADGSVVKSVVMYDGLVCAQGDFCMPPSLQIFRDRGVYAPTDPAADWNGYIWHPMPSAYFPIAECEYKGGAEYWAPVLGAFFLAGVVIVCAKAIAGIFRRETY